MNTEIDKEKLIKDLTNRVSILFVPEADLVLAIIRSHLYTEFLIEKIIINSLPHGEKITKTSRFTYSQKLTIVSALGSVKDEVIASLRALNKIRNESAHDINFEITEEYLNKLRLPLGSDKKTIEVTDHIFDLKLKFARTIVYLSANLASAIYSQNIYSEFSPSQSNEYRSK